MNTFGAFVTSFCTVCVLLGGMLLLCPSGALEKPVKYAFCLAFLVCVLTAAGGLSRLELSAGVRGNTGSLAQTTPAMAAAAAESAFRLALKNAGIPFSKVTVRTDKSDSGGIIITKVIVVSSGPPEKIRQALGADAGNYEVEIADE